MFRLRSYARLAAENKYLKKRIERAKERMLNLEADLNELLANIESTCVQNNYNNSSYKSHKILELLRDFEDSLNNSNQ